MRSNIIKKAGAVTASALVLGFAGVSLASAEPASSGRPYAAVGSDTTQGVWNGLTNGGPIRSIASWDAFAADGSTTITLNTSGQTIARPNGSGSGVKALSAAENPNNHVFIGQDKQTYTLKPGDISVARSSSAPSKAGNELIFLPFARDAMTFAYKDSQNRALDLSPEEIQGIFSCTPKGRVTINAEGKPVVDGFVLTPKVPNAASGTYSFFMKAAALTSLDSTCVPPANQGFPENNAEVLVNDGDIVPFSAAQWIAQNNGAIQNTTSAQHHLADIASRKAIDPASAAPTLRPGPLFGDPTVAPPVGFGSYARDVFNVVPARIASSTATEDVVLRNSITTLLKTTASKRIINKFGFMNLEYVGDWAAGKPSGYTN
ncbi:hypothetical protein [Sinomonas halotolerans]|uniref:Uncharacterized protein n=1 Tax=Sinomonas halotolerans TaxID=1644133 RepID=A0ABU9X0C1_9MICC